MCVFVCLSACESNNTMSTFTTTFFELKWCVSAWDNSYPKWLRHIGFQQAKHTTSYTFYSIYATCASFNCFQSPLGASVTECALCTVHSIVRHTHILHTCNPIQIEPVSKRQWVSGRERERNRHSDVRCIVVSLLFLTLSFHCSFGFLLLLLLFSPFIYICRFYFSLCTSSFDHLSFAPSFERITYDISFWMLLLKANQLLMFASLREQLFYAFSDSTLCTWILLHFKRNFLWNNNFHYFPLDFSR